MTIIFPSITIAAPKDYKRASIDNTGPSDMYNDQTYKGKQNKKGQGNDNDDVDNNSKHSSLSNKKVNYKFIDWQPKNEKETMLSLFEQNKKEINDNYKLFTDNPPTWNPKTNTYVYDFKGRVTEPSIKNFQLIPLHDLNGD